MPKEISSAAARERRLARQVWRNMHDRCSNPKAHVYYRYGAVGIRVCKRWNSFDLFLQDMGIRPSPSHSLDRYPNKNGNYTPSNCRWATPKQQANNKRRFARKLLSGPRLILEDISLHPRSSAKQIQARQGASLASVQSRLRALLSKRLITAEVEQKRKLYSLVIP